MEISSGTARRWARMLGPLGIETLQFARSLGNRREGSSRLLVAGTPEYEPWHFVAHMDEQASRFGRLDLVPVLLRWQIPEGAPAHLAVSVDRLAHAARDETVLVINATAQSDQLLERLADARRGGARIMSVHRGDADLMDLSHETLDIDPSRGEGDFEITQHVVTDCAPAETGAARRRWSWSARPDRLLVARAR